MADTETSLATEPNSPHPFSFWPYMPPGSAPMTPPHLNIHQMPMRDMRPQPVQPLSPSDFNLPEQVEQPPGSPLPQPGMQGLLPLSPQEKAVLRGMLDILKEGRTAMASGTLDELTAQRLMAAHAYLSGFLEARGLGELGTFLGTIPRTP